MKKTILLAVVTSLFLALFVGCGKPAGDAPPPPSEQTFNAVQFFQDFDSAAPELKNLSDKAWKSIQGGAFPEALKYLGQLDANPVLNNAQKKSVADLTGQVKKQMARAAAR
jgi:hypothetical protein